MQVIYFYLLLCDRTRQNPSEQTQIWKAKTVVEKKTDTTGIMLIVQFLPHVCKTYKHTPFRKLSF